MALLQAASAVGQPAVVRSLAGRARPPTGSSRARSCSTPRTCSRGASTCSRATTFAALLDQGVVPIVNENDAVADEEIRFGDNDRLAALVAVLLAAARLVMLTDTPGLFTADPARFDDATLIEEVTEFDRSVEAAAGDASSAAGTGGMASKLAAARLADVVGDRDGRRRRPRAATSSSRLEAGDDVGADDVPLAGAAARRAQGLDRVRDGAARPGARRRGRAPRAARRARACSSRGVRSHDGEFLAGDAVEVVCDGALVAKGLVRQSSGELAGVGDGRAAPRATSWSCTTTTSSCSTEHAAADGTIRR